MHKTIVNVLAWDTNVCNDREICTRGQRANSQRRYNTRRQWELTREISSNWAWSRTPFMAVSFLQVSICTTSNLIMSEPIVVPCQDVLTLHRSNNEKHFVAPCCCVFHTISNMINLQATLYLAQGEWTYQTRTRWFEWTFISLSEWWKT